MGNAKTKLSILEEEGLETNLNYRKYKEQKDKIKSKYPSEIWKYQGAGRSKISYHNEYLNNYHPLYKEYIKEILNLMLTPDSDFQKFTWDIIPDYELEIMKRRARGRKQYDKS